jgi:hypothetical protein
MKKYLVAKLSAKQVETIKQLKGLIVSKGDSNLIEVYLPTKHVKLFVVKGN